MQFLSNKQFTNATTLIACPLSLALMGFFVKFGGGFPTAILLLARFGVSAVVYAAILAAKQYPFHTIKLHRHVHRTILGFASVCCLFIAIQRIPLSTALCLSYTVPIFTYAMSVLMKVDKFDIRALFVATAVAGIALIVQPSSSPDTIGAVVALLSAFFGALALFEIKRLSKTEDKEAILLMYFTCSTIALLIFLLIKGEPDTFSISASALGILLLIGIFGLSYQVTLVTSLSRNSVSLVSLTMLTSVAVGYLLDVFVLTTPISLLGAVGMTILSASLALYQRFEQRA